MTAATFSLGVLLFVGYGIGIAASFAIGRKVGTRKAARKSLPSPPPSDDWTELRSGWVREGGALTGYVMDRGNAGFYWWISRKGTTIIEGPADSFMDAQGEIEQALAEFRHG